MTYEEKIKIMKMINWDTNETPEDMLAVIADKELCDSQFTRETLFARCLQRLKWTTMVEIWGIGECLCMYTPKVRAMIFQESRRQQFDRFFAFLRKEPVSFPEWGSEYCRKIESAFLPHGRYGIK